MKQNLCELWVSEGWILSLELKLSPGIAKRQKQKMFFPTDGVCYKPRKLDIQHEEVQS